MVKWWSITSAWQILKSVKIFHIFAIAFTISDKIAFQIFPSMANINLYKSHTMHFYANFHRFGCIKFWNVWPRKFMSRSCSTTFAMDPNDGEYKPLKKVIRGHFRYLSPFSRYKHFKCCDLENVRQGNDVQNLQWRHFMTITWLLSDGNSNVCSISHHL